MNPDAAIPIFLFLTLGAVILVPIILRNQLLARQLDALTAAMQHGIAPERVRESLQLRRDEGDVNGNWKAGQILTVIGWAYLPFGILGALAGLSKSTSGSDENVATALGALVPAVILLVIGYRLLRIHSTIIGKVVRRDDTAAQRAAGPMAYETAASETSAQ